MTTPKVARIRALLDELHVGVFPPAPYLNGDEIAERIDALDGQTIRSFDGHASVPTPLPAETPFSIAPEVPPRRETAYLIEQVNAMPVLKVSGEALSETLAETTGVVGADQFFCDWDEQEWFVAQSGVLALLESAATRTPEPPDSEPGTVAPWTGEYLPGAEPPDSGDGAAPSLDAAAWALHVAVFRCFGDERGPHATGHASCQQLARELDLLGYEVRLRSGSPAPEGGE